MDDTVLWKATSLKGFTGGTYGRKKLKWGWGVTHFAEDIETEPFLCTDTVIHAYRSPYQAALLSPILFHVNFLLWEAEGEVVVESGAKVGCRSLTTWTQVPIPEVTPRVHVLLRENFGRTINSLEYLPPIESLSIIHKAFEVEWDGTYDVW